MKPIKLIFKLLGRAGLVVLAYLGAVFRGVLDAVARGEHVPESQADDVHKYHYDMEKSHWNTEG